MERAELMVLLFLHGMALAAWFVPMGTVLEAANLGALTPIAFAASAIAALLSPLFFGAMADRAVPPVKVLRWIAAGSALFSVLISLAVEHQWCPSTIWLLIQLQALLSAPTNSLAGSIVFARLATSHRYFGSIRAMGTAGWMAGCWLVSGLEWDAHPRTFQLSGLVWAALAGYTWLLPQGAVEAESNKRLTLRERFGLDALSLLRIHDHRVIFLTAALVAIPFAAFFPYTPMHMKALGMERTSAWMSLGQVAEIIVMFAIGDLLVRWRLKAVILLGLGCGLLRYGLYAFNAPLPLLLGVGLHGLSYTFIYISTQIYFAQRIDPAWRTRAQALLSLMVSGVGNLSGYLVTGSWLHSCQQGTQIDWSRYWIGLDLLILAVLVFFAASYPAAQRRG